MDDLDAAQLLALVRGIHLPAAPAEPPVWPLLLATAAILVTALAFFHSSFRKRTNWASEALQELALIEKDNTPQSLEQTAALLKRIALSLDDRKGIKHLSGAQWLSYLDSFFYTTYFSHGNGNIFGNALYQENTQAPERLYRELKKLIRRKSWQQ